MIEWMHSDGLGRLTTASERIRLLYINYTGMDKTNLYTSSRTLFVREGGRMSTSRRVT